MKQPNLKEFIKGLDDKREFVQQWTPWHGIPTLEQERINDNKGSVQRKLRWVENGVNRSVGASDCGAGHCFVI
jgi:hypothetical protein